MAYIGAEPDGKGSAERFIFTALAGTAATVTHSDSGLAINYEVNHVSVYLNGVKQVVGTDVTASNGSTLVFASNLSEDDVVEVIALSTFAAAKTEGTSIQSTGETGGTKFLREDGDNSSSWQAVTSVGALLGGSFNGTEIVTPATSNIGVGIDALDGITTGDYNTAVGDNSATALTTGEGNTAVGYNALKSASRETQTAIGAYALENAATDAGGTSYPVENTAVGYKAAQQITLGGSNTAIGHEALKTATTSRYNVAVGSGALRSDVGTSADGRNVAVGTNAMYSNTTGNFNTCIGDVAGGSLGLFGTPAGISTGDYNICIGANVQPVLPAGNNQINIGNTIYGDTSTGDIWTSTTGKIKQKGAFMQSSTHQALTLGY